MKKLIIILLLMTNQTLSNDKPSDSQVAYLAGGCYWGLEELIRKLPGVSNTYVGFTGGHVKNVSYKDVSRGDTGHAESIKIEFNSEVLSFKNLLLQFFKMHDPTTLNQQGNDRGSQYRSVIFYTNNDQKDTATNVIELVNQSNLWENKVVTSIEKFTSFYPAEESHQKYLSKNPDGYSCHFVRNFDFTK